MGKKILEVGLNLSNVLLPQKHHFFCINGRATGDQYEPLNSLKTDFCNNIYKINNDSSTFKLKPTLLQRLAIIITASDTTAVTSGK